MDALISLLMRDLKIDYIEPDLPLLSSGLVDSLNFAVLLSEMEKLYGVDIEPSDVGVDNFDTPRQMHAFLSAAK